MTNTTKPAVTGTAAEANRLLENRARVDRHAVSEMYPDVDGIMATVTPDDQLSWSGCLAWALCSPGADGNPALMTNTTTEEIRKFYEWRVSEDLPGRAPISQIDHVTSWYMFIEPQPQAMFAADTGEESRFIHSCVFFTMDGARGISSEIAWLRMAEPKLDVVTRANQWTAYLDALRAQDAGKLADLMAPNVLGAVRDYAGAEPDFSAIRGREEMRNYYQRMFARFEILGVNDVVHLLRDWFVFQELLISVRARAGDDAGREFTLRVAEALIFDVDGTFQGRVGYGTALEPA